MKKFLVSLFFVLVLAVSLFSLVSAASAASLESCPSGKCPDNENYCVYYFYGKGCSHCANTAPVIQSLEEKYRNFTFYKLEIYFNETNQELFQDFAERYKIKQAGIPAVFISDKAIIGDTPIIENLENDLKYFLKNEPVCPLKYNKQEGTPYNISPPSKEKLTISAVIIAAAADSINPCAFAVLIFLLLYLTSIGSRKRMLRVGLAYIATVFIVYFLSGLGIFAAVQYFKITRIVFYAAAFIAFFAGIINIKDYFWYGKGFSLAIPEKAKRKIEKYIQKASMPAAIVLGIIVSMFELPCTGGMYLAILSLLADNLTRAGALPWLVLYNIIFVLPLIIIISAVYFGLSAEKADKIRLENRKILRLIMGLVMLLLGLGMLLGWFG